MSTARARLLVSGDFHLGRYPSRVPADAPGLDVASIVRSLVDAALERRVDALVLTGDVADQANKHYEAFGVLERELGRLAAAGIPVVAVAGNHDHDVAGAVADALPGDGVRVIGRGQRWQSVPIERDGREVVRVVGWSFAGPRVTESPLATFDADLGDALDGVSVPVVGVLHADLDQAGSPYAPVALADLRARPVAAWLLGHCHAPRAHEAEDGGALVLYPGSPQPLDPGEPGAHGAWLVDVAADGQTTARLLPLATLRYDRLDADLDGVETPAEARARVLVALQDHAAEIRRDHPTLRRAVVDLRLTGRTAVFGSADRLAAELTADDLTIDGLDVGVDRVRVALHPALDLERLGSGSGPVASLARMARRFEAGDLAPADRVLLAEAGDALLEARRSRVFDPLAREDRFEADVEAEALRRLHRQTLRLLDAALTAA